MLSRIRIQGLGVIEDAEIELAPGLNVITGETGAGKTMVVTGLGLLLGARADSGLVRAGSAAAVVEGEVDVAPGHPAADRVTAAGGDARDGLVLVRSVTAGGRSRAHVGGRAAPVSVLSEVGEHLVAVHGQADQWRLRAPEEHRALLDAFGGAGLAARLTAYREAFDRWQATRTELLRRRDRSAEHVRQVEMLRAALEEIEAVDPQPGEETELAAEADRLGHADALREAAAQAHAALVGDDEAETVVAALPAVGEAGAALAAVSAHDPELRSLEERVREIGYLLTDVGTELAGYAASVDVDPVRLAWVQQRQADLGVLLRKYGSTTLEVLAWARESAGTVAEADGGEDALQRLTEREDQQRGEVARAGALLSQARAGAGAALAAQVQDELAHLAMPGARVEVGVQHREDPEGVPAPDGQGPVHAWSHGLDEVEIRLAANAGAPPRSVARAASGGELSRVMLALEVVGRQQSVPTYVFDEVDAGVGGSAALDLGARLARLAEHAQVLVVTHLGQVAAFADQHLVVTKTSDGQVTASGVRPVSGEERVAEVARMLGGVSDSAAALEHARELLQDHASRLRRG